MIKRFFLTAFALAAGFGAAGAEDLRLPLSHGIWATSTDVCRLPMPGPVENSFIKIGRGTFQMYESSCAIGNVRQLSDGDYRATLTCRSEGMATSDELHITKHSPTRFTVLEGPGIGQDYVYCRSR